MAANPRPVVEALDRLPGVAGVAWFGNDTAPASPAALEALVAEVAAASDGGVVITEGGRLRFHPGHPANGTQRPLDGDLSAMPLPAMHGSDAWR